MPRRAHTWLNKIEDDMVEEFLDQGWNQSELIRQAIREFYSNHADPSYVKIAKDKHTKKNASPYAKWSGEELCVKLKGGVVDGDACVIQMGEGIEKRISLSALKEQYHAN